MTPEVRKAVQDRFLSALRDTGLFRESCRQTGVDYSTYRYWALNDKDFAAELELARQEADMRLRDELEDARKSGLLESQEEYARNENTGELVLIGRRVSRKQDARVLIKAAEARLPEYSPKQKVEVSGPGGAPIDITVDEARRAVRLLDGARELGLLPPVVDGEFREVES